MKDSLTITVSKKDDGSWQGVWKLQRNNQLYGNAIEGAADLPDESGVIDLLSEMIVQNFMASLRELEGRPSPDEEWNEMTRATKLFQELIQEKDAQYKKLLRKHDIAFRALAQLTIESSEDRLTPGRLLDICGAAGRTADGTKSGEDFLKEIGVTWPNSGEKSE